MNITFGYTRNKYDSLDIIQDVFLKLFTCNKKFYSLQDEKRWLIRVTIILLWMNIKDMQELLITIMI